jgi:hypothetical protein
MPNRMNAENIVFGDRESFSWNPIHKRKTGLPAGIIRL